MLMKQSVLPACLQTSTDEYTKMQEALLQNGFLICDDIFSEAETDDLIKIISQAAGSTPAFRKSADLFAIRRFLKEVPGCVDKIFPDSFKRLLSNIAGNNYFVVKSIYFDKPGNSNWFVAYHQDLTIAVDKKLESENFINWTTKHDEFAVQPPLNILQDNFTVRIHLDNTNEQNGALKVIPASHLKGIYRPEAIGLNAAQEIVCNVKKGGIMFMKPLLLHASGRTVNNKERRVIHVEFSRSTLPGNLNWAEHMAL